MATAADTGVSREVRSRTRIEGYPAGSLRFDWMAALLSTLFMAGLFLDGWAHNHGKVDQSFFTVWHFLFYSAFGLAALFLGYNTWRNVNKGYAFRQALPRGYWLSLVGVIIFGVGGVGDLIWHTIFGIEANTDALLSPTHLILALGMALVWSGPLRSAWDRLIPGSNPGWRQAGPLIISATLVLALLMFFTQFAHPITGPLAAFGKHTGTKTPQADIYSMNLDGTGQTRVTINQSNESYDDPVLSPDGSKLAFSRYNTDANSSNLYLADSNGQNAYPLISDKASTQDSFANPAWSPDGSKLAFTRGSIGSDQNIYVVKADGTDLQQVTSDGAGYHLSWSPDGSKIAYAHNNDNWDIYVVNADGSKPTVLAHTSSHEVWPAWSPDGSKILYTSFGNDQPAVVYVMDSDGKNPMQLTKDQSGWFAAWSPDGQRIVFLSDRDGSDQIYSMKTDGSDVQSLSQNGGLQFNYPTFTPDGTKILYTAQGQNRQQDGDFNLGLGIASVLLQSALLMGVILLLVRNWRLPLGTMTLIVAASALLISFMQDTFVLVVPMLVGGLLADLLLRYLRPTGERSNDQFYLFAFLTPALIYAAYFITLLLTMGITWSVHAAAGAVFLAGIVGLFIAFLTLPPFGLKQTVHVS